MSANPATKPLRIAAEPMGPFQLANCIVPRRLTNMIEKFLGDSRTGNIQLNIKDGEILGAHVEEFISFKTAARPAAVNGARRRPECLNRI